MTSNDEIWALYAKSVKKIADKKRRKNAAVPSPSRGGLGRGALRDTAAPLLLMAPSPAPAHKGRGIPLTSPSSLHSTTLERRVEKNLRQGEIELQARIDLHGMTQAEAHAALARFMAAAVKAGKRNLLIITGKGRGNAGVLKTNLPHWLQTLPEAPQILALRPAAPKHGGDGAFYVVLRKGSGAKY
jgi:DNA-nicking Smr family endonuclease